MSGGRVPWALLGPMTGSGRDLPRWQRWAQALIVAAMMAAGGVAGADGPAAGDRWVPPGTRTVDGVLVAARGLRDTSDAIAKELDRRGIAVKQVGPYRVRAVEVTRFISLTASTSWAAIHVSRIAGGRTTITFVGRPIAAAVPP